MRKERPPLIPCTFCKRYPFAAVGQLVRCKTNDCVHYRRGFKTVPDWNEAQHRAVVASIQVCTEYGLLGSAIEGAVNAAAAVRGVANVRKISQCQPKETGAVMARAASDEKALPPKVSASRSNAPRQEGLTWAGEGSQIIHHCDVTPELVATERVIRKFF